MCVTIPSTSVWLSESFIFILCSSSSISSNLYYVFFIFSAKTSVLPILIFIAFHSIKIKLITNLWIWQEKYNFSYHISKICPLIKEFMLKKDKDKNEQSYIKKLYPRKVMKHRFRSAFLLWHTLQPSD